MGALLVAFSGAVVPELSCAVNIDAMASQLAGHYGERPAGGGMDFAGKGAILFLNPARGTWTMVYFADAETPACIVGAGTDWRFQLHGEAL